MREGTKLIDWNVMEKYHKDVLLCVDGNIEYFEYKG